MSQRLLVTRREMETLMELHRPALHHRRANLVSWSCRRRLVHHQSMLYQIKEQRLREIVTHHRSEMLEVRLLLYVHVTDFLLCSVTVSG